ncbi:hypothetical protein GCM10023223_43220 [Stackebrandtia albiflava]
MLAAAPFVLAGVLAAAPPAAADAPESAPVCVESDAAVGIATFGFLQEQIDNALMIHRIATERGLPESASLIGVTAAMTDSGLRNLDPAEESEAAGVFAQSADWGTVEQRREPGFAAGRFFDAMVDVDGWRDMPPAQVAREVQGARQGAGYAAHQPTAAILVNLLQGEIDCRPVLDAGRYTHPVPGVASAQQFQPPGNPGHNGVDFLTAKGTPILAAGDGTVVTVECNAHTGDGAAYSCDVDGSPQVFGCGWYMEILHTDMTLTRYCHMASAPEVSVGEKVTAGQVIGAIGSSGNSSAPHLHFETHSAYPAWPETAVNPVGYFTDRGVELG